MAIKDGCPAKLTNELIASGGKLCEKTLTLAAIKQRLRKRHPGAVDFSLDAYRCARGKVDCTLSVADYRSKKRPEQAFLKKSGVRKMQTVKKEEQIY
ncbi:MAG: hypothetical protein H7240_06130 [Glaciimonas sp.]|nr:hypothetical protein [Glaciimonas sp.]